MEAMESKEIDKIPVLKYELFKTVKEYSEYSTIAGVVYLFMDKQTRCQFHQRFTSSFYKLRSQKCKKTVKPSVSFCAFGIFKSCA